MPPRTRPDVGEPSALLSFMCTSSPPPHCLWLVRVVPPGDCITPALSVLGFWASPSTQFAVHSWRLVGRALRYPPSCIGIAAPWLLVALLAPSPCIPLLVGLLLAGPALAQ
eukprot:11144248-Lingulodinium_polyedra.AAC.1